MTRDDILAAYRSAIDAVDPATSTRDAIADSGVTGPVSIAALGKAAPAMVRGAVEALGSRVEAILAVSDHEEDMPAGARLVLGSHPMPDSASLLAGQALLDFVGGRPIDETLVVLVSGGGSALAEVPVDGLTITDVADLTRRLMDAATPIDQLNLVRRHLSRIKNGGLLRSASAGRVVSLLISDVIDGDASIIASGPTLADGSTAAQAQEIMQVRLGSSPELPDHAEPPTADHRFRVVADCSRAADAAAASLGATVWTTALRGEASEMARTMIAETTSTPLVASGETTVTIRGRGKGGRNQEAALAAALSLEGTGGVFAALGTDGIDGPTEAAGGIVDGSSTQRMRAAGIDPADRLADNDAYTALEASGDLVITGPSGTNVGDLWISLPPP